MESPFESILHTNVVPSDNDCRRIQDFLTGPRQEAVDLSQEIIRIQTLLDELTRRRDRLDNFIDAHLALVSPARRVPQDIIRAIFMASMPTDNAGMIAAESPLLLCHICGLWRLVALSTPQLWASLHVVLPSSAKILELADAVTGWLSRSGRLPLSISLGMPTAPLPRAEIYTRDAAPLLVSLAKVSSRWKEIHLILPQCTALKALSHLSPADAPALQTMSIAGFFSDIFQPRPDWCWELISFLAAPSLQSVGISDGNNFSALRLSWTQLTHLQISRSQPDDPFWYFSVDTALAMLGKCSALQSCQFQITQEASDAPAPIYVPLLSHLEVTNGIGWLTIDALFANLVVPNLRALKYRSLTLGVSSLPPHMFFPSIESLVLDVPAVNCNELAHGLCLLPLLDALELRAEPALPEDVDTWGVDPTRDADFLARLAPGPGAHPCPNLRSLKLYNFTAASDDALLAFIEHRTGPGRGMVVQLTHVTVVLAREMQCDILPALHPFVAGGLEVSLEYSAGNI